MDLDNTAPEACGLPILPQIVVAVGLITVLALGYVLSHWLRRK